MPTHLSIVSEHRGGIEILLMSGEIDLSTAPLVSEALAGALTAGAALVADLTGVEFLDSAGAPALVVADAALAERGGRMLTVPSPAVRRVVDLGGLDSVLHLHASVSDALDAGRLFADSRRERGD